MSSGSLQAGVNTTIANKMAKTGRSDTKLVINKKCKVNQLVKRTSGIQVQNYLIPDIFFMVTN
jgi:hypothetical protein